LARTKVDLSFSVELMLPASATASMASYSEIRQWAQVVESRTKDQDTKLLAQAVQRLSKLCEAADKKAEIAQAHAISPNR